MSHPFRPRLSASSTHPRCYLGALVALRAAPPAAVAAREFRTLESTGPHWARLSWRAPAPLQAVTVVFPAGRVPTAWSITAEADGGTRVLEAQPTGDDERTFAVAVGTGVSSLEIRQDGPGERGLRIAAVIPTFAESGLPTVELCIDEQWVPVPGDALAPWASPLDVHDARELRVDFGQSAFGGGVSVRIPRLGSVGLPADVAEWATTIDHVTLDGRRVEAHAHLSSVSPDEVVVSIAFSGQPVRTIGLTLPPARGALFAIAAITLGRDEGASEAADQTAAEPAGIGCASTGPAFAGSVGTPRDRRRIGVTATGTLQWRPEHPNERDGSVGLCSHGTLLLESAHGPVELQQLGLTERSVRDGVAVLRAGRDGAVTVTLAPLAAAEGAFELRVQGARPIGLRVVQADYLTRLTEAELLAFDETDAGFSLQLRVGDGGHFSGATAADLVRATGPACAAASVAPTRQELSHPIWQERVDALLVAARHFERRDGSVTYGIYPSVYDGMVFGLEEDWLFYGLAAWGDGDRALRGLRATYLNETHLSLDSYLHDLRQALTPWQTERILAHTGRRFEDLTPDERQRVRRCGEWVLAEVAKTADATGRVGDDGVRLFPGLLPAFRFGGDLGFRTQSIYTSALAAVGLRALSRLDDDTDAGARWADAAARLTDAVLRAFDAASTPDALALHSGGGEPGSYYQLMAAGILHPVDFFARDDERAERLDRFMERDGRLRRGLPRFDDWGCEPPGIDAHYAVGYLLRALRRGRRGVFCDGLEALFDAGDPATLGWREVSSATPSWGAASHLPARSLSRSEPCVGGVGVALQLLRHALVTERYDADGRPGRTLALFAGLPPDWFTASPDGAPTSIDVPTFAGPISLRCRVEGGALRGTYNAPDAQGVEIVLPTLNGHAVTRARIDGADAPIAPDGDERIVRAPPGRHAFALEVA